MSQKIVPIAIRFPVIVTFMPEFIFETLEYIEDNGANRAVLNRLNQTEHKILLVQVRKRSAVVRPVIVNRA